MKEHRVRRCSTGTGRAAAPVRRERGRRRNQHSPVEHGAGAEGAPPVVGVGEARGVAEPVGAGDPRHEGRGESVVVPQRRGEPRVVARVVPEPLRHYDDTRHASRTQHTDKEPVEGREGKGREEVATGRMTTGLAEAVAPALGAARGRGADRSGSMSPPCLCRVGVARRGAACASRRGAEQRGDSAAVHVSLPRTIHRVRSWPLDVEING